MIVVLKKIFLPDLISIDFFRDVTRLSSRHICAPLMRRMVYVKAIVVVFLLAIIMDSGENKTDDSQFTNEDHSTPL